MSTSPESSSITMERMERLSKAIIESLRELSSANKVLSTTTLSRALAPNKEFVELLTEPASNKPWAEEAREFELQISALEMQVRKAHDRERSLLDQVEELKERISSIVSFQKKSIATLIVLARASTNEKLAASLERFRALLMSEADLSTLEECFQHIKHLILLDEGTENDGSNGGSPRTPACETAWSGTGTLDASCMDKNEYFPQVLNAFLTILNQFKPVSDNDNSERFLELENQLKSCEGMEALLAFGHDLVAIVHDFVGYASEERSQVAYFVRELGKNLLDMENQLSGSLNDVQKTYQANTDFNDQMQGQVEDIKESFGFNKTLEEIRSFVLSKIKAIKTALEKKRKQDEVQIRSTKQQMTHLQKRLQNMKTEINQVQERTKLLEQEVQLDSLIGIHNRRAYQLRMQEELQRYHRYNQTFSLVMFDVDHFKQVNDRHGHKTGDRCLMEIINRIRPSLRKSDFLARYGGEEFVIILTGTPRENACKLAEKIRLIIENTCFACQGQAIPVTISLGVTQVVPSDHEPEDVFARVDAAMYKAKNEGRNRVATL